MSLETILTTLNSHFNTQWAGETAIAWQNVNFDPTPYTEYVAFYVKFFDERQITHKGASNAFYRLNGAVMVQVYTASNKGAKRALELADTAANIFRGQHIGGLRFFAPTTNVIGNVEGRYQVNISVSFYTDIIH